MAKLNYNIIDCEVSAPQRCDCSQASDYSRDDYQTRSSLKGWW